MLCDRIARTQRTQPRVEQTPTHQPPAPDSRVQATETATDCGHFHAAKVTHRRHHCALSSLTLFYGRRRSLRSASITKSSDKLLVDDGDALKDDGVDNPLLSDDADVCTVQAVQPQNKETSPLFVHRKSITESSPASNRATPVDSSDDEPSSIELDEKPKNEKISSSSPAKSIDADKQKHVDRETLELDQDMNPLVSVLSSKELLAFASRTIPPKQVGVFSLNGVSDVHSTRCR